ncbi:hypothetical protein TA3x_002493 [Tundrisphaera sp. TA3]|uniref:hypothetical protein n=1 Tax=Tundrisphaera sp. TA3 TaxID=3435775 RepID=UPI003EBE2467
MDGSKFALGRLPWGLIASIVAIAGIESYIAGRGAFFRDPGDWGWAVTEKAARVEGPKHEILAFGDSLAKMGLVPEVIEAHSGRSTYNLAVTAGQAPSSYYLLQKTLDAGARPRAILVDFFPRLLQVGVRDTPYWHAVLGPGQAAELAWKARDPELFATIMAPRLLSSLRARHGLRMAISNLTWRPWGTETSAYRRNWRENRGAQLMPCGVDPNVDFPGIRRAFYSDAKFDPVNVAYIHRFLDLAASRSIPVYYLLPPIKPALQAECEGSGFEAAYRAFLREIQDRHPSVVIVDGRHADYDPALFHDANHLGRDGAWAFSAAIGDLLRERPPEAPGPLWVDLPAYRGLPAGSPPEDLNESRAALVAERRAARLR